MRPDTDAQACGERTPESPLEHPEEEEQRDLRPVARPRGRGEKCDQALPAPRQWGSWQRLSPPLSPSPEGADDGNDGAGSENGGTNRCGVLAVPRILGHTVGQAMVYGNSASEADDDQ